MITITIDDRALLLELQGAPDRISRAVVRALNRAIKSGRTLMVREIARDTGLKSSTVREAIPIRPATLGQPTATMSASMKKIPLIEFKAKGPFPSRGKGRGVSYSLPGSAGRNPNAFLATMGTGHEGVFKRLTKARLPIIELYGPSIGHVFMKYRAAGEARTKEMFLKNFEHEFVFSGTEPTATPDLAGDEA